MRRLLPVAYTLGVHLSVLLVAIAGCGGLAEGESVRGNATGGNRLGQDLIVSEDGATLIVQVESGGTSMGLRAVDLRTRAAVRLDVPLGAPRMVFGATRNGYFLGEDAITEVSLDSGRRLRRIPIEVIGDSLTLDDAKRRLAVWSRRSSGVALIDLDAGHVRYEPISDPVHDVRFIPTLGDLAVVSAPTRTSTRVTFFKQDGTRIETDVPNCASALRVAPKSRIALLAPSACSTDPVSVIDLGQRRFVKNLPGFGPVDFSPDGSFAVAFGRGSDLGAAGIHTRSAYSLLFIALPSLEIAVVELGNNLPTYRVTPDGDVVLLYDATDLDHDEGLRLVDVAGRMVRMSHGPAVHLDEFVMTPDGREVFLVDGGLYRLDVASGEGRSLAFSCGTKDAPPRCVPDVLNLLPDGTTLVLGYFAESTFALYDTTTERVTALIRVAS